VAALKEEVTVFNFVAMCMGKICEDFENKLESFVVLRKAFEL